VFEDAGGVLRTSEARRAGVHPRDLYALRDEGVIERVNRGTYRLAGLPAPADPDLVAVAARIPRAVVALISALQFHGLTTEIPHEVNIALPKGMTKPTLDWPPIRPSWFSEPMFGTGIESYERDRVRVRVYSPAKSVADCFRFRNRIGTSVAIEALRTGLEEGRFAPAEFIHMARVCRVEAVVRPYLDALL